MSKVSLNALLSTLMSTRRPFIRYAEVGLFQWTKVVVDLELTAIGSCDYEISWKSNDGGTRIDGVSTKVMF